MSKHDLRSAAAEMEGAVSLAKSFIIGDEPAGGVMKAAGDQGAVSNLLTVEDYSSIFTNAGAVEPVYDPEMLTLIFEHSNSLRQNVDSYATNIDGFGHRFDPFIDLESADVDERIRTAMLADSQRTSRITRVPTDDEVAAKKEEIRASMRTERARLEHFFEYASATSFVTLRRHTRQDLEVLGNAYWEVLRSPDGEIARFVYVTAFTMRLMPLERQSVTFLERMRVSDLSFADVPVGQRVRKYVQVVEGQIVFFKEFGDPRVMSAATGMYYPDLDALQKDEGATTRPATEVMHFKIHSPRSPYGVPRWIGNLLSVVGSRQAEEVNFTYFENKSVPPLAILVQGGRMNADSVKRVTDYVQNNIKGKRNFHKILVLEAEAPGGDAAANGRMKFQIQPLTSAQHSDALFQNYDERNIDKVGGSFRLPRLLRGDIRDFNRSTADAALTFAEMQVFQPERQEFDFIINRKILAAMSICYWKFVSLAPVMRDPAAMSEIIRNLANANVLTPEECRQLAGDVFNRDFRHIRADWVKQPAALTLAGIPVDNGGGGEATDPSEPRPEPEGVEARAPNPSLVERARRKRDSAVKKSAFGLLELRDALRSAEAASFMRDQLEHARHAE